MKKIFLFLISTLLLFSRCTNYQPCNEVESADKDYIVATMVSNAGIGGFKNNGYKKIEVLEVNQTIEITDSTPSYNEIVLPIAHNYPQTTFIFKGDTLTNDTLIVNSYNARAELIDGRCGYQLKIDEPKVSKSTFTVYKKESYESYNSVLTIKILK